MEVFKMDTRAIGRFVAELRKEKKLTQEELGKKLGVTNKTISRWENGNYMPDISLLIPLSRELNISVNELLLGRRLQTNEFQIEADRNLVLSFKQIKLLQTRKKQYDFLEGTGIGILLSALYCPDAVRKIIIIIISLLLICSGWILKRATEKQFYKKISS